MDNRLTENSGIDKFLERVDYWKKEGRSASLNGMKNEWTKEIEGFADTMGGGHIYYSPCVGY